jgi:hypothetical protein
MKNQIDYNKPVVHETLNSIMNIIGHDRAIFCGNEKVIIIAPERPLFIRPLPDPPPDELRILSRQIAGALKPAEKKNALQKLKALKTYVNTIEKALANEKK